jgi:hypothetical protein
MRIAEKTFELNFCSEMAALFEGRLRWFGLTQAQEAKAGFDACAHLGGSLVIFQFKISRHLVRGARRFRAPHPQMEALRQRTRPGRRIYYALPMIGTTGALIATGGFLDHTWLLDVAQLPYPLPPAIGRHGHPRAHDLHYIDADPPQATVHSEALRVDLVQATSLRRHLESLPAERPPGGADLKTEDQRTFRRILHRNAIAAIVLPP